MTMTDERLSSPTPTNGEFAGFFDNLSEQEQFDLLTLNIKTKLTESALAPATYINDAKRVTYVPSGDVEAENIWLRPHAMITVTNPPVEWVKPGAGWKDGQDPWAPTYSLIVDGQGDVRFWTASNGLSEHFHGTSSSELSIREDRDPQNQVLISLLRELSDAVNDFNA